MCVCMREREREGERELKLENFILQGFKNIYIKNLYLLTEIVADCQCS